MPFEIVRNDITRIAADAIVNTANPKPLIGGGTDGAIHYAAGPRLLEARKKIGDIAVGTARKTPAFDLPARYVLHTVAPEWIDGAHGEEALLRQAYDAALALAQSLHCRSAAFPLLSAGTYGFPPEKALAVAIGAFTDFLQKHEMRIILTVFGQDAFIAAKRLFYDLKTYVDDRYVDLAEEKEYGGSDAFSARRREAARLKRPGTAQGFETARLDHVNRPKEGAPHSAARADLWDRAEAPEPAMEMLAADTDLESILNGAESTFSEYLLDLLKECGEKDSDVYRRAEISRQLFHKIVNKKDYQPTKSTAIQLALGLRLDLPGTQKLLERAGYSLTRSSKTDLVVQCFIERGEYSIVAINLALYDCGLPLLKTGSAS